MWLIMGGVFRTVRNKFSYKSHKKKHKPFSYSGLEPCNVFRKAQNKIMNQQDTRNLLGFTF